MHFPRSVLNVLQPVVDILVHCHIAVPRRVSAIICDTGLGGVYSRPVVNAIGCVCVEHYLHELSSASGCGLRG